MSSRPQYQPYPVIVNGDMSQATITSAVTVIPKLSMLSYAYSWTGSSPVGSISVEVSNDYSQNADGSVRNSGTWNSITLSSSASVSGNTGNGFIDIDSLGGYAVRTKYTKVSGTGTLQATVVAKVS